MGSSHSKVLVASLPKSPLKFVQRCLSSSSSSSYGLKLLFVPDIENSFSVVTENQSQECKITPKQATVYCDYLLEL